MLNMSARNDEEIDMKALNKSFKRKSIEFHPDKNQDRKEWAQEKFIELNNAKEILADTFKRDAYDVFF